MHKNKKSKKERLEKLHMLLDNPSGRELPPEDKKYLEGLRKRLDRSSKGSVIYAHRSPRRNSEKEVDSLTPSITIHRREKKSSALPEFKRVETVGPKEQIEDLHVDEELYEVEKVEVKEPEFLEVKPEEITEKEEEIPKEEKWERIEEEKAHEFKEVEKVEEVKEPEFLEVKPEEITEKEEETSHEFKEVESIKKEELPEWEPVEIKKRREVDLEEISEPSAEKKLEEKEEKEPVPEEKPEEEIPEPDLERESKIDVFRDIKSIDEKTAVLLYDNGFTSVDALREASLKDLTRIKGIKRKVAKKIKEELKEEEDEWLIPQPEEEVLEESIDKGISAELEEVKDEEPTEMMPEEAKKEEEKVSVDESPVSDDDEEKIKVFNDIRSIDKKTAVLLYDNGFTSVDALREASLKDLTRIKGVKRKIAKNIKRELEEEDAYYFETLSKKIISEAKSKLMEEPIEQEESPEEKEEKEPVPEEKPEEEIPEPDLERESKIDVFREIKSIDEKTAVLLYDNGFTSVDALREASLKDLTRIEGIKRKAAKQIKEELKEEIEEILPKKEEDFGEYLLIDEKPEDEEIKKVDEELEKYEPEQEVGGASEEGESPLIEEEGKIDVFRDIKSVDKKTAVLLYENGITSVDILIETPIKELTRIKGIKRKLAKRIKKEIDELNKKNDEENEKLSQDWDTVEDPSEKPDEYFVIDTDMSEEEIKAFDEKLAGHDTGEDRFVDEKEEETEWVSYYADEVPGWKSGEGESYMHGDYTLYKKEIGTKSGKKRPVYFFSKAEPDEGKPVELPPGFEVKINKKTGVPYLRKKK